MRSLARCRPAKAINQDDPSRTHDPDNPDAQSGVQFREHEPGHGSARPTCSFTRAAQVGMCDNRIAFNADVLHVLVVLGPELRMAEVVLKVRLDQSDDYSSIVLRSRDRLRGDWTGACGIRARQKEDRQEVDSYCADHIRPFASQTGPASGKSAIEAAAESWAKNGQGKQRSRSGCPRASRDHAAPSTPLAPVLVNNHAASQLVSFRVGWSSGTEIHQHDQDENRNRHQHQEAPT